MRIPAAFLAAVALLSLGIGACSRGGTSSELRPQSGLTQPSQGWNNPNGSALGRGVERGSLDRSASALRSNGSNSPDTVYFSSDSAELTPDGLATLAS